MAAVGAALAAVAGVLTAAAAPAGATGYGIIRTVAGNGSDESTGDGGLATEAGVGLPYAVEGDGEGSFYFTEYWSGRVRMVGTDGVVTTVAGGGAPGDGVGDGGAATDARLDRPQGLALDGSGNLFVSEGGGQRVRRIGTDGTISTVAGTGEYGCAIEGGPATAAPLSDPAGIHIDDAGNLYIAQPQCKVVRMVDTNGIIATVAGDGWASYGDLGDGGPATEAFMDFPNDVAVDGAGNLYISDSGGNIPSLIRMVDTDGIIHTVAGGGSPADGVGDGGAATDAMLNYPRGVDVDAADNVYIADTFNNRVRRVDAAGVINTVAGTGQAGFSGDGGPPAEAQLSAPWRLDVDETMGVLVADSRNNRIRQVVTVPDLLGVVNTDSPDPLNIDEELTYTVDVTNNGTAPATGVVVTDTLPVSVDFMSATTSQGSCSERDGTVSCALGEIAAGATVTVTITVTPTTPGVVTNTVTVSADGVDPYPPNNTATAETSVGDRGCAQVVTTDTRLSEDVGPCPADGIVVGTDNVTLDLGGYRVFGFDGTGDGTAAGIRLPRRSGVTVTNGTVSGFDAGVAVYGGGSNTVHGMTVRDNVGPDDPFNAELGDGIYLFNSASNTVTGNIVAGNGIFDGIGVWGPASDNNRVEGNTVTGTVGPSDEGPAGQGIIVNGADGRSEGTISGSVIAGNLVSGNGSAGIANINHVQSRIIGNVIEDNGFTNARGNGIGLQLGPGFRTQITSLRVERNEIHRNAESGILVNTQGNTIRENNAADNALTPVWMAFDLHDTNPDCAKNAWVGNTWGSGGYSPECTARGGGGPALTSPSGTSPAPTHDERVPATRRLPSTGG